MKFLYTCAGLVTIYFVTGGSSLHAGQMTEPDDMPATTTISQSRLPAEPSGVITLEMAVTAALARHPSLAATWYEIEARKGAADQAGALPNPTFFGEVEEFGGSGDFSGTEIMSSRIGISQEIPLGGKVGKRVREADAAVKIAELEHLARLAEMRASVETRFFEVFYAQERLNLQSEYFDIVQKSHDIVASRVKIGDTSPLDLTKSKVELASARIEIEQLRKELEAARYALAESWGAQSPVFSEVSSQAQSFPEFKLEQLKKDLEQSPSWRLLDAGETRAEAALDLARAQSIPDVEVEGGVQQFNESNDNAFFIGVSIPLPLFNRNRGGVTEANAARVKADYERKAGMLALQKEIQEAWTRHDSAGQVVRSLDADVLPDAQYAYESISKAYKAGETDLLGLLDARRTWVEARKLKLDKLHELDSSRIVIRRLIGEGIQIVSPLPAD